MSITKAVVLVLLLAIIITAGLIWLSVKRAAPQPQASAAPVRDVEPTSSVNQASELRNQVRTSVTGSVEENALLDEGPTDPKGYMQLLPKTFKPLKSECVDFSGDSLCEPTVLGQDYADVKLAGTGDEIASYEVFVFAKNAKSGQWAIVYHLKADSRSASAYRTSVIAEESFKKISLRRPLDAVAFLTTSPSASGPCMDTATVLFEKDGILSEAPLGSNFPLCLQSFRQELPGMLELVFSVFRVSPGGSVMDAQCCPTGGTDVDEYQFQDSSFHKVEHK